jgi:hypothetical protein
MWLTKCTYLYVMRISVETSNETVTLRFEGKVIGPWVEECRHAWQQIQIDYASKKVCLDLCEVTFVDEKGTELFQQIHQSSAAKVLADSPLTRYFADRITQKVLRNKKRRLP